MAALVDGTTQTGSAGASAPRQGGGAYNPGAFSITRYRSYCNQTGVSITGDTPMLRYITSVTTLVGIQLQDKAILCADSQITEDNLRTVSTYTPKIVAVGRYLLGITGDSRPGDILAYNWTPPAYKGADPVQWMGKKVMPSILAAFKENGYDPYEATKDKDAGFDYLVSFAGNLFHIACDLSFIQSNHGLYGLGSGGHFALGYLHGVADTFTSANVKRHAEKAVQIAAVLDVNTCLPLQYVSQDKER